MTIVATWVNLERINEPSIWTVADTKISNFYNLNEPLTLEGAKVLEIPIVCRLQHTNGPPYYKTSIGFSYAGSTLIGLQTHATVVTLFCNLLGRPGELPDHESLIDKVFAVLRIYSTSIPHNVEISLWGFCPKTKLPFVGTLKVERENPNPFSKHIERGYFQELSCLLLGCHKSSIHDLISSRLARLQESISYDYWRVPIYVLREVVEKQLYQEIGGNLQLAIISQIGQLTHFAVEVASNGSSPLSYRTKYRNIDLYDEIGCRVGDCIISIPSLDLDFPH